MLKRLLLTMAFTVATFAAAAAFDLDCGAPRTEPAEAEANPVVRVTVLHNQYGWRVKHQLRDGNVVSRNEQYAIADFSNGSKTQWQGTLYRNSKLTMVGEIKKLDNGQLVYVEWLYDTYVSNNTMVMRSWAPCQQSGSTPAPPPQVATAPSTGKDSVPIIMSDNGKGAKVDVLVGGMPLRMIIDTGATHSSIPTSFAYMLIKSGQAEVLGSVPVRYADGRVSKEIAIRITELRIGSHVVRNVLASVSDGSPLLAFPILNDIAPFTIDTRAGELIWHTTRG